MTSIDPELLPTATLTRPPRDLGVLDQSFQWVSETFVGPFGAA